MSHAGERSRSGRADEKAARVLAGLVAAMCLFACRERRVDALPEDAVVVILPREPEQLDPRFVSDAYGFKVSRLLHASLVRIDPRTLEPVPELARSIELEGETRYRVRLRPGLRFSDGSSLDTEDVVATYRGLVDPRVKSRFVSTFSRIVRLEVVSALELVFELAAPHATFLTDLEFPILRAEDALEPPTPGRKLVGAGPYRLVARSSGLLSLTANPYHHRQPVAHPALALLVIHDDNTRAMRMLAGAGDLALNTIPPLLLPLFDKPTFRIQTEPGLGTTYIGVNLEHPALRDVRVRRAIAHAIDRRRIVTHKLLGLATLASSWVPPGHWAYADDVPTYDYDPAHARALLDEAGFPPPADGFRLSLTLRTSSDRAVVSLARALASMLGDVGIDLDVRPSESASLLADLARGRFELACLQGPNFIEPHVLSWFFASDRIPQTGVREGGNRWRLRSPELDAALEQGRAHVAHGVRLAAYRRVQHLLARELPVIPLWHEDVVAVTSRRLPAFEVPRDAQLGSLAFGATPP